MKFSIITITYNSKQHLEKTIVSVLSQDYTVFEYILVDGGSIDGTLDIIKRYADNDSRIRWVSEPDNGIADAFNKGIALSTGKIIGILNSDDAYAPGALQTVVSTFAAHPECDVFHGDILKFQYDKPVFLLKPANIDKHIWHEMPINHPSTFVTMRAYKKIGNFDTSFKVAMDYDLILRLYKGGCKFCYIEGVLAHMRYGGESDVKFISGLKEVYTASVRKGYPKLKAVFWLFIKMLLGYIKIILRKMGLYSIMRLHPRFKTIEKKNA